MPTKRVPCGLFWLSETYPRLGLGKELARIYGSRLAYLLDQGKLRTFGEHGSSALDRRLSLRKSTTELRQDAYDKLP